MGLDIYVYKPKKVEDPSKIDDDDSFYLVDLNPELEIFKDYIFARENEYYDLETALGKIGKEEKNLRWVSTEFGKKTTFKYLDKDHQMYNMLEWLDDVWADTYFDSLKELRQSELYKIYERDYHWLAKEHGWKPSWKFFASGSGKTYYNFVKLQKFVRRKVKINIKNPPTLKKIERCVLGEEIGWQRKGANKLFYKESIWDTPAITRLDLLKDHWEKYFSFSTPESEGGFGSGVEFDQPDDEMKKNFKMNILDKFVEGETFVIYG